VSDVPDIDADVLPQGAFWLVPDSDSPESSPRIIAERLMNECPRFAHLVLGGVVVIYLFRGTVKRKGGRQILGSIHLPVFQGELGKLAYWMLNSIVHGPEPDFLMLLDWHFWAGATPMQREALVFHELCHTAHAVDREGELRFTDEGRPVFELRGHDVEEFGDVVARYGAWLPDIQFFFDAAVRGGVTSRG
jgi:hypothetical protein